MALIQVEKNFTFKEGGHIHVPFRTGQIKDVSPDCAAYALKAGCAKMIKGAPKNKAAAPESNKKTPPEIPEVPEKKGPSENPKPPENPEVPEKPSGKKEVKQEKAKKESAT